jgi:hypothetical protein
MEVSTEADKKEYFHKDCDGEKNISLLFLPIRPSWISRGKGHFEGGQGAGDDGEHEVDAGEDWRGTNGSEWVHNEIPNVAFVSPVKDNQGIFILMYIPDTCS